jgi:hypothetical protein
MASSGTAHRPLIGWLFLAAGVLFVLQVVLGYARVNASFLFFVAAAALTVAFVLLFLWRSMDTFARTTFLVAAVGWGLFAVASVTNIGVLGETGSLLALAGSLGAGIVVYLRRPFPPRATTWFLVAMILAAAEILNSIIGFLPGIIATVLDVAFAAVLVVAGLFIAQRR